MPVGTPANSSTGTLQRGFSPSVISCIRRVVARASGTEPADEADDRRRRGHREAAQAGGLGDRGVADVGVGVVGPVVAEVEAVGDLGRPGEPLVAGARDLDPEVGAVARHRDDHRRARDVAGRVERELAGGHREVEEEVVVAADEPQRPPRRRPASAPLATRAGPRSRSSIRVPARLRLWASSPICSIWPRIAVTSTGSAGPDGPLQQRAEDVAHPAQPVEHLGGVGAVAQDLAEPLVERAVGAGAGRGVLEHEHPHARRDHAGHRADGARGGGTARGRHRVPPSKQRGGVLGVVDQALERGGAHQGAAERPGGAVPGDRRARVQELAVAPGRAPRGPGATSTRTRLHGQHPLERAGVGVGTQRVEGDGGQVVLGARQRRPPVDAASRRHGLVGHGLGEQVDADADDVVVLMASSARGSPARVGWRRRWTGGPRRRRRPGRATWRSRPCGSWAVPTTRDHHRRPDAVDRGRQRGGGVVLGAVAEDDVEQDHARRRVGRDLGQPLQPQASGRSSGGPGRSVYSSSPKSIELGPVGGHVLRRRPARRPPASCVPPTNSPCSRRRRSPARSRRATGQAGTSRPRARSTLLGRGGQVGPAGAEQREVRPACPAPSVYAVRSRGDLGGRRLGDQHDELDAGVGVEPAPARCGSTSPPTSADRSRPPTPYAVVTPTPAWSSSASTCWQPVPDAATMPTGPGETTLANPSPSPPTTAVPQSGPITSRSRLGGVPLERDLLLERHVVAEDHHVAAGLEGVHGLDGGTRAGHRHQHERAGRRAAAPRRGARGRLLGGSGDRPARRRCRARSTSASTASSASASSSRTATTRWLTVASAGTAKPIRLEHLDVEGRRHRHLGGRRRRAAAAPARLTWSSVTESA